MTEEEAIFAYIDGELDGDERKRVEAMIAADPALQILVAEHRALGARLDRAFSSILDAPSPKMVNVEEADENGAPDSNIVSLVAARLRRDHRRTSWSPVHWTALAATLIAGIISGVMMSSHNAAYVAERGDQLVVAGNLEIALDTQLASNQGVNPAVRIGLTFRNQDGAICRSFSFEDSEGVACHQVGNWQLQGLLRRESSDGGTYRMASSSGIAELVDSLIVGEPMDAVQERNAFSQGWEISRKK